MSDVGRRRFLRLGGAGTVGALSGCLWLGSSGGSSADSTPWPAAGGGPERTWARPNATAVTGSLSTDWSRELPGPVSLQAVVDDTAFLGSSDRLVALDVSGGEQRWTNPDLGGTADAAVVGGVVYCSDGQRLEVLDASNGSQQWSFEETEMGLLGDPVVSEGSVYVLGSSLHVLDARTGEKQWEEGQVTHWTNSLTVSDGDVYLRQADSRIACHRRDHSGPVWSVSLPLRYVDQPRRGPELLYVGGDVDERSDDRAVLFALDPATGERRWQYDGGGDFTEVSSPAIGPDALYVWFQTADGSAGLAALDAATGEQRWRQSRSREITGPALFGETVYAAVDSAIVGLATDDGTQQLERSFADDIVGTPIVVGDHLYAVVDDRLYALEQA